MPGRLHDDEPPEGMYSLADLEAMAAAGDIELAMPGTPEADAFDRRMAEQLAEYDRELLERDGPDALTSERLVRQMALAAERDPGTVGHALLVARRHLGYDHAELARGLGVDANRLALLAIKPWPDPSAPIFATWVHQLAEQYGADPGRLAEALG